MIDNKDRKILAIMADNSRISKKQLAKQVNLSREVVDYRLKRLEQNGIILGYQARLNLNAFSIMGINLFIKLKNYDDVLEAKLVNFFKNQNYTHFIGKIGGNYDYMVGFTIKKLDDLKVYLDELYENFNDLIYSYDVFTMLEELKDNVSTIFDPSYGRNSISMKKIDGVVRIDEIDKFIIEKITNNARISSIEIGSEIGLTGAAVSYRIKRLEKDEIILGYRTIIDVLKLDKQFYYLSFNLSDMSSENRKKIVLEIVTNPNIVFANNLTGKYSYVCWLFANDNADLYEIIKKMQNRVSQITNINTYTVLDFIHHTHIPNRFLDD